jgi:hypothetical protein
MSAWEESGATDEWYTPRYIFDALGETFDMDVAHPGTFNVCCVPATSFITHDSLSARWDGFVWMNPPFGGRNALHPWLNKFCAHGNGIGLTPDRTSAPWFQHAWAKADLALFMPKVRFLRPDGSEGASPSTGTTLWACGDRAVSALQRAAVAGLGILAQPMKAAA